jgi:benzoyl-CoA-dihydrodiol lyase
MSAEPRTGNPAQGASGAAPRVPTQTDPARYRHWKLKVAGPVATLLMDVQEGGGLRPGYELKLNSYDLGVDIELADAVTRLRFEHPQVRAVVLTSAKRNVFCAGANIFMLGGSSHPFKVNFCKYTNETRLAMEEASRESGQVYLAALNGITSGGGYELALACEEIHLIDDRSSAVSLPEVPYLAVLPGTGGLTRLVDKRLVRRDLADAFATLAEGCKGKRALEWKLVDAIHPPSAFEQAIAQRAAALAERSALAQQPAPARRAFGDGAAPPRGIALTPLHKTITERGIAYRHVTLTLDGPGRVATLLLKGPDAVTPLPADPAALGADWYPLALFRELDDALVELRFNYETAGVVLVKTQGDLARVLETDALLHGRLDNGRPDISRPDNSRPDDWFRREVRLLMRRALKRMDVTARTFFALVEPGSCFGGMLAEVALAADRIYMRRAADDAVQLGLGASNAGPFPMGNGLTRLAQRFLGHPAHAQALLARLPATFGAQAALEAGLVTAAPDELDWDDEVRIAVEERVSLSPDALTGMEASLRFAGPETMETKIFARLSAWQNWVFTRPNATGPSGALTLYGKPGSPEFDFRRT